MTAPINLIAGLPRASKTLRTLHMVRKLAEEKKCQVYYAHIEILDKEFFPWIEIDPHKWMECPPGSIVVIDEAHKYFGLRSSHTKPPPWIEAFAELGHDGQTVFLITQHGNDLDVFLRRRIGYMEYIVRRYNKEWAVVFHWDRFVENAEKSREGAQSFEWPYDKSLYGKYRSATLHTVKGKVPWRVKLLFALPFVLAALIYGVYRDYQHRVDTAKAVGQSSNDLAQRSGSGVGGSGQGAQHLSRADWIEQQTPRLEGLPFTAPAYDNVTQPTRAPYPAACVMSKSRCQCYTQQATKLTMSDDLCRQIAQNGFFKAWDDADTKAQAVGAASSPVQAVARSDRPAGEPAVGVINGGGSVAPARDIAAEEDTGKALARARRKS